jgi:hypothetical protein
MTGRVLLPPGEGGATRRMRAARPTIRRCGDIVGRVFPHPALPRHPLPGGEGSRVTRLSDSGVKGFV